MRAVIVTRAIKEAEDKNLINNSKLLKIAVNTADVKADIRIFVDCQNWKEYLNYPEILITRFIEIPEAHKEKFIFFNPSIKPCTQDNTELFVFPSTLGAAIDLAYKIGIKELLLVADNDIEEDGTNFLNGFRQQSKDIVDFYNTKMNIYQFSKGNFNIKHKAIRDFV